MNTLKLVTTICIALMAGDVFSEWSIGVYEGKTPFSLIPKPGIDNPVLTADDVTDVNAAFVADPFIIHDNNLWYLFFEVYDANNYIGKIAYATSSDGVKWTYKHIILNPGYHLSYPHIFKWNGEYYMILETYRLNSINLYKANNFPNNWTKIQTLVSGRPYVDPSIFYFDGKWWLFASTTSMKDLYLFFSNSLTGPWIEHPHSPVITDDRDTARPGGRVIIYNNHPVRFTQDTYPVYGSEINAFEIIDLSTTTYRERARVENPILMGSGYGWNEVGMHQIDPYLTDNGLWMAIVDGNGDPHSPAGVPRENWELEYVDSEEKIAGNGLAMNAFDGDSSTMWHSEWSVYPGYVNDASHPHEIQINLSAPFQIEGFSYLPRQDGEIDGSVKRYEFHISQNRIHWGDPVATGVFDNSASRKFVNFNPKIGKYIKFTALSEINNKPWTTMAEIALLGSPVSIPFDFIPILNYYLSRKRDKH